MGERELSFGASVAAVKRNPGETAEDLADRIAADNHSETEQGWSIRRAIEEVELDLTEAVTLLHNLRVQALDGDCPWCNAKRGETCEADCELGAFLSRMDEGKRG